MALRLDEESWTAIMSEPQESSGVEFKNACTYEELKRPLVKAALGLVNHRDGGFVVIGVDEETNGTLTPTGLTQEELDTYNRDDLFAWINSHADPGIKLEMGQRSFEDKDYLVLQVDQFDEVPVLCKKQLREEPPSQKVIVQEGRLYVRATSGKIETICANTEEMRLVLRLAVDNGMRNRERQFGSMCRFVATQGTGVPRTVAEDAAEKFDEQLEGL